MFTQTILCLAAFAASAAALTVTAPTGATTWDVTQPLPITWSRPNASDPDSFNILLLKPGSSTFTPVALNLAATPNRYTANLAYTTSLQDGAGFVLAFVQPPATYYAVSDPITITNVAGLAAEPTVTSSAAARSGRRAAASSTVAASTSILSGLRPATVTGGGVGTALSIGAANTGVAPVVAAAASGSAISSATTLVLGSGVCALVALASFVMA